MDFAHRPKQYKVLDTTVTITEVGSGGFDLDFDVDGPATSLTIELCFRPGGTLDRRGARRRGRQLPAGRGRGHLHHGPDVITFGPGNGSGPAADPMDAGEKYTYLGGSLVPSGQRVYITGGCRSATRCASAERALAGPTLAKAKECQASAGRCDGDRQDHRAGPNRVLFRRRPAG